MRNFGKEGVGLIVQETRLRARRRSMGGCYEPSTLISWVHEQVPFVDPGFNNSGETAEDLVDNLNHGVASFYDYFLVGRPRW